MNFYNNLEKRERIFVLVGCAALILVFLYYVSQGPLVKYRISKTQFAAARECVARAREMSQAIRDGRKEREAVQNMVRVRGDKFDMWTSVRTAAERATLFERADITSQPNEQSGASAVKVSLRGASMEELTNFLYYVHSDELIILSSVNYLRPAADGKGLDCEMVLMTPSISAKSN